jgi:hypothetical protein
VLCCAMKTTKVVGLLLLLLAAAYFVYPIQTGNYFDSLTMKGHNVDCDVNIGRGLGNPYINSVSCSSGAECGGLSSLTVIGDYAGNVEMDVDGKTVYGTYTVGLGVLTPAQTTVPISTCVHDGNQNVVIRILNGDKTAVLDTETSSVGVGQ